MLELVERKTNGIPWHSGGRRTENLSGFANNSKGIFLMKKEKDVPREKRWKRDSRGLLCSLGQLGYNDSSYSPDTLGTWKFHRITRRSHEGMSTGTGDGGGSGGGGVQGGAGGRNTPPHGSPTPIDKATLKVHLPNGGFNVVKFGDAIDVKGIISLVTSRLAVGTRNYRNLYAMRLHHPGSGESYWLHQDTTMYQVQEKYEKKHPHCEWRYELRVRYLPQNLNDLYEKDKVTFYYYYDQVRNDYLYANHSALDQDVAVQLCCLEIRYFFKDMPQMALDKKSNLEYLEREVGLHKFLPRSVLNGMKPKALRKLIQQHFKKVAALSELECMFKFFDLLRAHYRFDQERFICALGSSWSIPVELVIGPDLGISYMAHRGGTVPTRMTEFSQIQSIQTLVSDCKEHAKACIKLRVAGATETLSITCSSLDQAESLADLIDGYCRLVTGSNTSLWNRKDAHPPKYRQDGFNSPEKNVSKTGTILSEDYAEIVDEEGDYSTPASIEILLEEKHQQQETMRRENRRVQAMSWGADEVPPPKPSRQPQNTAADSAQLTAAAPVSTYIVAQSPEVLAQLLKDNQTRGVCPSVYTTPASPFNTLAVQFQDEDQVLTTAVVSDLPFFDPAISEPTASHDTQSGDSTLSDTNLDSLDSSDTVSPLMSSLNISDTAQTQSPAAGRKQQKVKEMQNLYAVSSKVVSNITGDLYSPVQKFSVSNPIPITTTTAACGEIYGPVANFTQSSAIVGNLSQSPSVGGNFGENPGNFGPSSLNNQTQFVSGTHAQSSNLGQHSTNITSQAFTSGQQSIIPSSSSTSNTVTATGSPRINAVNVPISTANAECLYGPVLKFRAQSAQSQSSGDMTCVSSATSFVPSGRSQLVYSPTPVQNIQSQPLYPQNYQHQQIYSNVNQMGQHIYIPRAQQAQNIQRQPLLQPQSLSYTSSQHTMQQNQTSSANPIYTAHATSVTVVQAQKVQMPNYIPQVQSGIANSQSPASLNATANQHQSFGVTQAHGIQSRIAAPGVMIQQSNQQHTQSHVPNFILGQHSGYNAPTEQTQVQYSATGFSTQQQVINAVGVKQQVAQMAPTIAKSCAPQIATGIAKITTFVTSKQDEPLTSSTDGTLSGSLISSAVSDSTMSSSSSMTEEAQQDQRGAQSQIFDSGADSFIGGIDDEQKLLEQRLLEQQRQSEEDSRWLAREEKRLSIATSGDESASPPIPRSATQSPNHEPHTANTGSLGSDKGPDKEKEKVIVVKKMEPTPTADLDRTNDKVYDCTTSVVRAVMSLSQGVQQSKADQYLELVRKVGIELRALLSSVDALVEILPISAHREVEMAHKVLSKDMAELVTAMKLAQSYSATTLDAEYRKGMLSAAHILAMDAKNLLDVIDSIRIRYPYVDIQICQKQNDQNTSRDSTPEHCIRSSQSGEHFLRRSQSSDRQATTFRQSQSGDLLHRMGQSVDRSLQGSQTDVSGGASLERRHHIVTNSLERNSTSRRQMATNSLERKRPSLSCNMGPMNNSVNLPPIVPVTCNLVQTVGPVIHPSQTVAMGVSQQSVFTANKSSNETPTSDS
ncbi:hypothetical protein M0802_004285 [Mischocyttarus mexicanus]|nr:hypothetical protein M0802_004285 [Mischocyttarus mexicanus]